MIEQISEQLRKEYEEIKNEVNKQISNGYQRMERAKLLMFRKYCAGKSRDDISCYFTACQGDKSEHTEESITCPMCQGEKTIFISSTNFLHGFKEEKVCSECNGKGSVNFVWKYREYKDPRNRSLSD